MKDNPVIARVRNARHGISQRFDHDPKKLVAHYIQLQKSYPGRLISSADANAPMVAETGAEYGKKRR